MTIFPLLSTDVAKLSFASTDHMRTSIDFLDGIHTSWTHCIIEFIEQELNLCIKARSGMFLKWTVTTIFFGTLRTDSIITKNNKHNSCAILIDAKFHERIVFDKVDT